MNEANHHLHTKQLPVAEHLALQLIKEVPDFKEVQLLLARTYYEANYHDKTLPLLDKILSKDKRNIASLTMKAAILFFRKEVDDAIAIGERLVRLAGNKAYTHNNLGVYQMAAGNFDEAARLFRAAIALDENYVDAYHNFTDLHDVEISEAMLSSMIRLSKKESLSNNHQALIHHSISKYYRKNRAVKDEFAHLNKAKHLMAQESPWDETEFKALVAAVTQTDWFLCDLQRRHKDSAPRPIFVSSMPRSGSTLLEQMLSSHPEIDSVGESGLAFHANRNAGNQHKLPGTYYWQWPENDTSKNILDSAFNNFDSHLHEFSITTPYFLEKSIDNDIYLGLCLLAFPDAKVIHCRRNPLDTCLSCYQSYFSRGIEFSNNLSWLAKRYQLHCELMEHWERQFPGQITSVNYESIVAAPEDEISRLLQFIGAPWSKDCLKFHENDNTVRSASNWQVRQPLYKSSTNRWQMYREQLQEILFLNG